MKGELKDSMEIIAALLGAGLSGFLTWIFTRSQLGQQNGILEAQIRDSNDRLKKREQELKVAQEKVSHLVPFEEKYLKVKSNLQRSAVVKEYIQPVLLVGPRGVGKTSLLMQWHAPWDRSPLVPSSTFNTSTVPIYDYKLDNTEPHFADPDILSDIHVHLKLQVHDFPGELKNQRNIIEQAKEKTRELRKKTNKSLGVVLICMFDASESVRGLSSSTNEYYNGELFLHLRQLVMHSDINVERLILVFNKYDKLIDQTPCRDDKELMIMCLKAHDSVLSLLRATCNSERICEVFTILNREDIASNNRGAPVVLGESAKRFVEAMAGHEAAKTVVVSGATTHYIHHS